MYEVDEGPKQLEEAADKLQLWCLSMGSIGTFFLVEIDGNKQGMDLVHAIKAEKLNDLGHIDADNIRMCTAKVDHNTLLPLTAPLAKQLRKLQIIDVGKLSKVAGLCAEEVEPWEMLKDGFCRINNKQLHVLIVTPPPLALRTKRIRQELSAPSTKKIFDSVDKATVNNFKPSWEAMVANAPLIKRGYVINDVRFLDEPAGLSICIRTYYPQLLDHVMDLIKKEKKPNVIIGDSGIGKTFFRYLLVWHLVNQGRTVVYENKGSMRSLCVLFTPTCVTTGSFERFYEILTDPSVADGVTPGKVLAKTILGLVFLQQATSKYSPQARMELEGNIGMPQQLYAHLPASTVADCLYRWGGVARYVLLYAEDRNEQRKIGSKI